MMEFSFPLNRIDRYIRLISESTPKPTFDYEGIILYYDYRSKDSHPIQLCLYTADAAFNLDLKLPPGLGSNGKTTNRSCPADIIEAQRPNWDLVFFSKGDFERALRMAKKNGAKKITFKSIACFPRLGAANDGLSGYSNLILMAEQEVIAHNAAPNEIDYSFGKPYPPIWKDEALSIAFRLIEHKLVNNQWLINLVRKVDALQQQNYQPAIEPDIPAPKKISRAKKAKRVSKPLPTADTVGKSKATIQKITTEKTTLDNLSKSTANGTALKLKSKPAEQKKKTAKKKSKKHFKINNLGFKM